MILSKEFSREVNYPAILKKKKKEKKRNETKQLKQKNDQSYRNEVIVNRENYNEVDHFHDTEISITRDRRKTGVKSVDLILG